MEINKPVSKEEAAEFLKPMKHYEYNVVEQLKKIPTRIFLMSLILIYEPHHNALQIVLNKAYVPQNIAQKTMKHFIVAMSRSHKLITLASNTTHKIV
jgi:hypothetical protein